MKLLMGLRGRQREKRKTKKPESNGIKREQGKERQAQRKRRKREGRGREMGEEFMRKTGTSRVSHMRCVTTDGPRPNIS